MKEKLILLAAAALVAVACVVSIGSGSRGCERCLNLYLEHAAANDTQKTISVLRLLKDGKTNDAVEILEGQLDGSLSAFANYVKARPQSSWHTNVTLALKSAKAYRLDHPQQSSPASLTPPIGEVLSRVQP